IRLLEDAKGIAERIIEHELVVGRRSANRQCTVGKYRLFILTAHAVNGAALWVINAILIEFIIVCNDKETTGKLNIFKSVIAALEVEARIFVETVIEGNRSTDIFPLIIK